MEKNAQRLANHAHKNASECTEADTEESALGDAAGDPFSVGVRLGGATSKGICGVLNASNNNNNAENSCNKCVRHLDYCISRRAVEGSGNSPASVKAMHRKTKENIFGKNNIERSAALTTDKYNLHVCIAKGKLSPETNVERTTPGLNNTPAFAEHSPVLTTPNNSGSSRTSVNNSTDNLSYNSDKYFPDDELFELQSTFSSDNVAHEDDAEKISLYSDDCIYAYRGDGTEFELAALDAVHHRSNFMDDETDFLEMDFEPDPSSEVECSSSSTGVAAMERAASSSNVFLQRDECSSIENRMATQPLQSQSSHLSNNFSSSTRHLNQIKAERSTTNAEAATTAVTAESATEPTKGRTLAQSLPNSLMTPFGRETQEDKSKAIPMKNCSKITGAKPKRLNTFPTTSSSSSPSTSSKTISSKLRNSVRPSVPKIDQYSRSSFDERSVRWVDFLCPPATDIATDIATNVSSIVATAGAAAAPNAVSQLTDETCLDCLEKEFLANTIGKAMDLRECIKCTKRRGISKVVYASGNENRGRVLSSLSSHPLKLNTRMYNSSEIGECSHPKVKTPEDALQFNCNVMRESCSHLKPNGRSNDEHVLEKTMTIDSSRKHCAANPESMCSKHIIKNMIVDNESVTISTQHLDEDTIVQALEKLHIMYNAELIKLHFRSETEADAECSASQQFRTFKHFILNASKQQNNYPRCIRLMEMATCGKVEIAFKKDPLLDKDEMVPLHVSDIIHQWKLCNNLESLMQLDKRFHVANVLGKIANVIRQSEQRCSLRRQSSEEIMIPQYYANGYLKLAKMS